MRLPRLVATDLDGTLVRSDGTLSEPTRAVLARLDGRGVPVVFVTARPLRWMDELWPLVGAHGLAVVSNGAIVYDVAARQIRELRGIEAVAGGALVRTVRAHVPGAVFAFELVSGFAHEPAWDEPHHIPPGSAAGPAEELLAEPVVKMLVKAPGSDPAALRAAVSRAVGRSATATWSVDGLVEVSAAGVTKAAALARVCAGLGVDAADVVAFGDMPNDLPMLEWAGTSYAVANGHPSVLEAADHVVPGNDEDGVAVVLAGIFEG